MLAGENFTWSAFWLKIDADGDGEISEPEFVAAVVSVYEEAALATRQAQVDAYLQEVTMEVTRDNSGAEIDETYIQKSLPPRPTAEDEEEEEAEVEEEEEEEEEETPEETAARHRRQNFEELSQPGAAGFAKRQALFKEIDEDTDGTITLKEALQAIALQYEDFDNLSACMMAYEAADRDGNGLGWRETRLFFQYQLFYDDAWEIFRDMDTNADQVVPPRITQRPIFKKAAGHACSGSSWCCSMIYV